MKPILAHKGKLDLQGHGAWPDGSLQRTFEGRQCRARSRRGHCLDRPRSPSPAAAEGPFEEGFDPPHSTIHAGTVARRDNPEHHFRTALCSRWSGGFIPGDSASSVTSNGCRQLDCARRLSRQCRAVHPACGFSYDIVTGNARHGAVPPIMRLPPWSSRLAGTNSAGKVSLRHRGRLLRTGLAYRQSSAAPGISPRRINRTNGSRKPNWKPAIRFIRGLVDRLLV